MDCSTQMGHRLEACGKQHLSDDQITQIVIEAIIDARRGRNDGVGAKSGSFSLVQGLKQTRYYCKGGYVLFWSSFEQKVRRFLHRREPKNNVTYFIKKQQDPYF